MTGVRNTEIDWLDPPDPLIRALESLVAFSVFLFLAGCTCEPPTRVHKTYRMASVRPLGNEGRKKKEGKLPGMGTYRRNSTRQTAKQATPANSINFYNNHCRNNGPLSPKPQINRGSGTKIGTPLSLFYYHTYENN